MPPEGARSGLPWRPLVELDGSENEVTYNIDDGFSYRKKRSVVNSISVNAPQLSDIVGGHFIEGV